MGPARGRNRKNLQHCLRISGQATTRSAESTGPVVGERTAWVQLIDMTNRSILLLAVTTAMAVAFSAIPRRAFDTNATLHPLPALRSTHRSEIFCTLRGVTLEFWKPVSSAITPVACRAARCHASVKSPKIGSPATLPVFCAADVAAGDRSDDGPPSGTSWRFNRSRTVISPKPLLRIGDALLAGGPDERAAYARRQMA